MKINSKNGNNLCEHILICVFVTLCSFFLENKNVNWWHAKYIIYDRIQKATEVNSNKWTIFVYK